MLSDFLKSLSILKKFLFINLIIFLIIGSLTLLYIGNAKPNLIKNKKSKHIQIIDNTIEHILRLNIILHGKLRLDPSQLECEWDSKQLPDKLTTTEFLIVKELAKRPGIIKERAQLMDIAYREDTDIEDRTIDSHVKRIRKKFKKVDPEFTAIETRYGSGYRWNVS